MPDVLLSAAAHQTLKCRILEIQSKQSLCIIHFCRMMTMMANYLLLTLKRR